MELGLRYRQLDAWFRDHPAGWFVAAVIAPGPP